MIDDSKTYITTQRDPNTLRVNFFGSLNAQTVTTLWPQCMDLQLKWQPKTLLLDFQKVSYCDGAGIGLLVELRKRQLDHHNQFQLNNVSEEIQALFDSMTGTLCKPSMEKVTKPTVAASIGEFIIKSLQDLKTNIIFLGMVTYYLVTLIWRPKKFRWQDFWHAIEDVGPKALFIVALIGFLVGLISAFQAATPMARFGTQIFIINLAGLGLFREMGPLMTAVLLAGRTASAFAAELGTMKVDQEIDALTTMGLEPVRFLTIPRILAAMFMTPVLSIFFIVFGLFGCFLVMSDLGFNYSIFMHQLYQSVTIADVLSGLIKTFVFGIVIAGIGCLNGFKTKFGASSVGYAATQAVVSSLIMIVVVDGVFASIYYALGI